MTVRPVVSPAEWVEARKQILTKEKEHTRQGDIVSQKRRELPWVKVDKEYTFEGEDGPVTLADLFEQRSQLVVQHFMFGPDWDEGCVGCSFLADHVDDAFQHLYHHDVSFVAISRAPYEKIAAFKERMGWKFNWVSAFGSDFNFDYHVSVTEEDLAAGKQFFYNFEPYQPDEPGEIPGMSVFFKDEAGNVYHTYSTFDRGDEPLINTYNFLDIAPKGRNESNGDMDWIRHHDRYESN